MFQENTFVTTKEAIKFIDEVLFNGEKVDGLKLYKINDKYDVGLENYDGDFGIEISEKLSVAIREEFKEEKEMIYLEDLIG